MKVSGLERVAEPIPMDWHDQSGYAHRSDTCPGHILDANQPTHCLTRPRDGEFKVYLSAGVVLSDSDL